MGVWGSMKRPQHGFLRVFDCGGVSFFGLFCFSFCTNRGEEFVLLCGIGNTTRFDWCKNIKTVKHINFFKHSLKTDINLLFGFYCKPAFHSRHATTTKNACNTTTEFLLCAKMQNMHPMNF